MQIIKASKQHINTLVEFNQAMALETEGRQLNWDILQTGVSTLINEPQRGFYLVCQIEGKTVASLMVTFEWSDWQAKDYWWIQSVYVQPDFRRQGIYSALYQQVKRMAAEQGSAASFRLYVEKENLTAQRTYQTLGMKPCQYDMYEEK